MICGGSILLVDIRSSAHRRFCRLASVLVHFKKTTRRNVRKSRHDDTRDVSSSSISSSTYPGILAMVEGESLVCFFSDSSGIVHIPFTHTRYLPPTTLRQPDLDAGAPRRFWIRYASFMRLFPRCCRHAQKPQTTNMGRYERNCGS